MHSFPLMPLLPLAPGTAVRAWWPDTNRFYKACISLARQSDAGCSYRVTFSDGDTRENVPRREIASSGHCARCDKDLPWVLCALSPAICLHCRCRINDNVRRRVDHRRRRSSSKPTLKRKRDAKSNGKQKEEEENSISETMDCVIEPPAKRTRSRSGAAVVTQADVDSAVEGLLIMSDDSAAEPSAPDIDGIHGTPGARPTLIVDMDDPGLALPPPPPPVRATEQHLPALALPPLMSAAHKRTYLFAEALTKAINKATAFPFELDTSLANLADPTVPGPLADWLRTAGYVACRGPHDGSLWIAFRLS